MIDWWQHIPEHLDPIVFTVGFLSLKWYALSWLVGFLFSFLFAKRYLSGRGLPLKEEGLLDLFLLLFFGTILGGHFGYALFYRPELLLDPLGFFSPYSHETGTWTGIAGMSFHGGVIGVASVLFLFARKYRQDFFRLADVIVLAAPIALFFGRIGNFLNRELPGRVTEVSWGMYFPGIFPEALRHPSTLYEALGEGALLFLLLVVGQRLFRIPGQLSALFLVGYGTIRFGLEYFREPDPGVSLLFMLTRGQILSVLLIASGVLLFVWLVRKNRGKIVM
jgi:phosphatidylglycerol---prolipoprotein diacylglyceryl transferase